MKKSLRENFKIGGSDYSQVLTELSARIYDEKVGENYCFELVGSLFPHSWWIFLREIIHEDI